MTYSTKDRWTLPSIARDVALIQCAAQHELRIYLHVAIVMPDHVHLLFDTLEDPSGHPYRLPEIMRRVKGASSRAINKKLERHGTVWHNESFDHILRADEDTRQTAEYILQNPVRAGLVDDVDEYPWIWRSWIEGDHFPSRM